MLRILSKSKFLLAALLLSLSIISCKKGTPEITLPLFGPNQEFYVLANNSLLKFNANNIKTSISQTTITGLSNTTERLLTIDFRPATGELYGISSASKIYTINLTTGLARAVTTIAFTPALSGDIASMDFNPTADRIRLVTSTGQNLRINPETGVAVTDTNLSNTAINGVAYSNSFAGATSTILYDIDPVAKVLYKQDPPNNGTLVRVGSLELDLGTNVSFDISPDNKNAIAVAKSTEQANLYVINLSTGFAELKGKFPKNLSIQGIAMATNPAVYAIDSDNNLLVFNPTIASSIVPLATTGLQTGETILGMDMRPAKGQIYALGSTGRLYTLNGATGAFTSVGLLSTTLTGTSFGFDFNPVTDSIRIVSNSGQNLRVSPTTAAVTVNTNITTPVNTISAAAYSNNYFGADATLLYVVDHTSDKLYTQEQSTGVLKVVGDLKVNVESTNGFDILSTATANTAYGFFTVAGKTGLYRIELSTGLATLQGEFDKTITAFTLGLRF
ncbi:MAG: DUF4394 domain-containing protein [Pedobacter sp.]|nr:MAG: DUF4394 domain-containing protein [Pedobacter sp.]